MKKTMILSTIVFGLIASGAHADRLSGEQTKVLNYLKSDTSLWGFHCSSKLCKRQAMMDRDEDMKNYMRARNNASHLAKELDQRLPNWKRKKLEKKKSGFVSRINWYEDRYPKIREVFKKAYEKAVGLPIDTHYHL